MSLRRCMEESSPAAATDISHIMRASVHYVDSEGEIRSGDSHESHVSEADADAGASKTKSSQC
eukprot:6473373-Amphidinium_carterae.1